MNDCRIDRARLVRAVNHALPPGEGKDLTSHLDECDECAREFALLQETWDVLPEAEPEIAPDPARQSILEYARAEGGWSAVDHRPRAHRARWGLGVGALALTAVFTIDTRGGFQLHGNSIEWVLGGLFVAIAALLGTAAAGVAARPARNVTLGALGALTGYVALTVAFPVNQSVDVCGRAVFGQFTSLYQVCSTYLLVTAAYAAGPALIVGYLWSGSRSGRRWPAASALFTAAALPLVLLQAGFSAWLVPLSAVGGFVVGALLGGWGGQCARFCLCGIGCIRDPGSEEG